MKEIVVATNNKHKLKEIKEILKDFKVYSLSDIGFFEDIEENGETFEENALIKARAVRDFTSKTVLSDDTGLCVDYLSGRPGIYSARYAGEDKNYAENNKKLLRELKDAKKGERLAEFVCAVALCFEDKSEVTVRGIVEGEIGFEEKGTNGFGYDPLFIPKGLSKTYAELSEEEKNALSHRKRALEKAVVILKEKL